MYSTETELTNDILKLQADILGEDVKTDHPYLKKNKSANKSKQLITDRGFIVGAINELKTSQDTLTESTLEALSTVYNVLGQIGSDDTLKERVLAEAPSLIELVLEMNNAIGELADNPATIELAEELQKIGIVKYEYIEEVINVDDDVNTTTFSISKPTIDYDSLKFFVNGIYYPNNGETYTVNKDNRSIIWTATSDNGGFDLDNCQVIMSYNYQVDFEEEPNNG